MISAGQRRALASRGFRRLWWATSISELGSNIGRFAFILLVHELSRDEPDPEFAVALVMALETVPMILLGPVAGALVDRLDRRTLLVAGDALSGLLLLCIPWLAGLESHVPLYAAALVFSSLGTVFHPTRLSAIPDLVAHEDLADANSLATMTSGAMLIVDTLVVAPLIVFAGRNGAFYLDAMCFLVSGFFLLRLALPQHNEKRPMSAFLGEVFAGLRYLRSQRILVLLTVVYFATYAFIGAWWPLLPSFVDQAMELNPDVWAPLFVTAFGLGGLVGGAAAPALSRRFGKGRVFVTVLLVLAVVVQFFAHASNPTVALIAALAGGSMVFTLMVLDATLVQESTEPAMRGRVFGAREPMRAAGMLFATTLVMTFASSASPRTLMVGTVRIFAVTIVLLALLPAARGLRRE